MTPARLLPVTLAVVLAAASCTSTPDVAGQADGPLSIEGTINAIDLQPWIYDGHAVVQV